MTSKVTDPDILLWPKLSRFYGLSFTELRRMKRVFLRMYAEQMETLEAKEMLDRLMVVSFPYMEDADHRGTLRHYERLARDTEPLAAVAAPPESKPVADPAALTALGISVVRKQPKEVGDGVSRS